MKQIRLDQRKQFQSACGTYEFELVRQRAGWLGWLTHHGDGRPMLGQVFNKFRVGDSQHVFFQNGDSQLFVLVLDHQLGQVLILNRWRSDDIS